MKKFLYIPLLLALFGLLAPVSGCDDSPDNGVRFEIETD
jgi:hypothetical protein